MAESLPNHKYYTFVMSGTVAAHDEDEAWRIFTDYYDLAGLMRDCDVEVEPDSDGEIGENRLDDLRGYDAECEGCASGKHKGNG